MCQTQFYFSSKVNIDLITRLAYFKLIQFFFKTTQIGFIKLLIQSQCILCLRHLTFRHYSTELSLEAWERRPALSLPSADQHLGAEICIFICSFRMNGLYGSALKNQSRYDDYTGNISLESSQIASAPQQIYC